MSFLQELQSVQLRKPSEPIRDFSSPKTAGFLKQEEIDSYQSYVLDVNTEEWLDRLKNHTFPSAFVKLTLEEARLLKDIYERLYANLDPVSISKLSWETNLEPDEADCIREIQARLQKAIDVFTSKPGEEFVFVKLSSRSPKDAPMAQTRFKAIYSNHLMDIDESKRFDENTQITCLLKASFDALRISTAAEAIDACMRSERTYQDLLLALAVPERYRENFVVRKFVDIEVDMEFRAFVYQHRLTAISQYNYLIYSERLVAHKDLYCQLITSFFETEISPKLRSFVLNYVIDFAICNGGEKVWVIEINPFLATTDSALFSWEHERSLLEGVNNEVVNFRVTERPRPGAKSMLPIGLKDLILECNSEIRGGTSYVRGGTSDVRGGTHS